MANRFNVTLILIPVAIGLTLSACSSSPTEGELKAAIETKMKADSAAMELRIGKQGMPPKPELKNVRKIACKADGDKAYRCEVELEVNHDGTLAKGTASIRFLRNNEGWIAGN